jgi:hypothetical protein
MKILKNALKEEFNDQTLVRIHHHNRYIFFNLMMSNISVMLCFALNCMFYLVFVIEIQRAQQWRQLGGHGQTTCIRNNELC